MPVRHRRFCGRHTHPDLTSHYSKRTTFRREILSPRRAPLRSKKMRLSCGLLACTPDNPYSSTMLLCLLSGRYAHSHHPKVTDCLSGNPTLGTTKSHRAMAGCPHIFHLIRVRKKARRTRIYWSVALGVTGESCRIYSYDLTGIPGYHIRPDAGM
jgi:hypothetical protein